MNKKLTKLVIVNEAPEIANALYAKRCAACKKTEVQQN